VSQDYTQAFGQKCYFQVLKSSAVNLDNLALGGIGVGKFMDISTMMSNSNTVKTVGTGDTFKMFSGTPKTITNAALQTNEATLTFAAIHGITVGQTIIVADLPAPFTSLNGTYVVTAATTSTPFTVTYAKTGTNITSAAVAAGTAMGGLLLLDGTDAPIQLKGLTNITPNEGENEETVVTYDDEAQGNDTSKPTSKTHSIALEGMIDISDAAYKLYRIASKNSVREKLMIKWATTAPNGFKQDEVGYGRFTGYQPGQAAGTLMKFSTTIKTYGPYDLLF
jgi:hypothetical protein